MKTGSSAPRVWLNANAVWELLDRLDISQNQLARLSGMFPGRPSLLRSTCRRRWTSTPCRPGREAQAGRA